MRWNRFYQLAALCVLVFSQRDVFASGRCESLFLSSNAARAVQLRENLAARGDEFIKLNSRDGIVSTDVLAIGAGPMTAAFAANYRGGRLLAIEATSYAGTFDRGRNSFFMNLPEGDQRRSTIRSVYQIPGSSVGMEQILANPNVPRVALGERTFPGAGAVGDLTLEALNGSRTPVRFNTRVLPIEFSSGGLTVKTDTGLTIQAKYVIMAGHGEPRLSSPGGQDVESAWIYATDKNKSHRRILHSDDFAIENSELLTRPGRAVVTGDSYGALISLDKLLRNPKVKKIFWVGKTVPAVAQTEPELYRNVLDAVANGRIALVRGATLRSFAVSNPSAVGVQIAEKQGQETKVRNLTVSQHVLAMGYHPENQLFGHPDINPIHETVVGFLPVSNGVRSDVETEIAGHANGVYFLGFRQGISNTKKHWFDLGLRSWFDYTFRAAALGSALSTDAVSKLVLTKNPVTETIPKASFGTDSRDLSSDLSPHFSLDKRSAHFDLQVAIGWALRGHVVSPKRVYKLRLRLAMIDGLWKIETSFDTKRKTSAGGFVLPNGAQSFFDERVQTAFHHLTEDSAAAELVVTIPVVGGALSMDQMAVLSADY